MLFFIALIVLLCLPIAEEYEWGAWLCLCTVFVVRWVL